MTTDTTCPNCQRRRGAKHTAAEIVLLAFRQLEADTGLDNFDHDAIVVAAWKIDSGCFGMRDHPYPDSKRVSMEITKLSQAKHIENCEPRRYRLTDTGRERAGKLQATG